MIYVATEAGLTVLTWWVVVEPVTSNGRFDVPTNGDMFDETYNWFVSEIVLSKWLGK